MTVTAVSSAADAAQDQSLDSPAFECAAYAGMKDAWLLCRDMMEGTTALRRNAAEYLPQEEAESAKDHAARVKKTELYPMFKRSVVGLTGIVFRVDPQLADDLDKTFREEHWTNIDGAGTHGVVFGRQAFEDGMQVGHVGILVDVPAAPKPIADGAVVTIRDEAREGIRPYWVRYSVEDIMSWRIAVIRGKVMLTQLVLRERTMQPLGEFMEYERTRYLVYKLLVDAADDTKNSVTFDVWEQTVDQAALLLGKPTENGELVVKISGPEIMKNATEIPFACAYMGQKLGELLSRPPLVDLAYTNVAHAQVLSDHRHSLHKASVPILVMYGRGEQTRGTPIGSNTGLDLPPKTDGAGVEYVEHQGSALEATHRELQQIETRGGAQGLSMLQPEMRSTETATANRLDRDENTASLSSAARSMEDTYKQCIKFHLRFMGKLAVDTPTDSRIITVNKDFNDTSIDVQMVQALSTLVTAGQLPQEIMWEILRTGGIIPEDVTDEQLLELLLGVPGVTKPGAVDDNADGGDGGDGNGGDPNAKPKPGDEKPGDVKPPVPAAA